jgi:hypothetical protein
MLTGSGGVSGVRIRISLIKGYGIGFSAGPAFLNQESQKYWQFLLHLKLFKACRKKLRLLSTITALDAKILIKLEWIVSKTHLKNLLRKNSITKAILKPGFKVNFKHTYNRYYLRVKLNNKLLVDATVKDINRFSSILWLLETFILSPKATDLFYLGHNPNDGTLVGKELD